MSFQKIFRHCSISKSSSIHCINGDKPLSQNEKKYWELFNKINNRFLPDWHFGLKMSEFNVVISPQDYSRISLLSSPSRTLSDLFWMKLNYRNLINALGDLCIFDTGTGKGHYSVKLQTFSEGLISSYFGTDINHYDSWKEITSDHPSFQFKQITSDSILSHIPEQTNMFISQSAIEHFEYDLQYFRQVREFINRRKRKAIQVHLVPSAACKNLFSFHGVRQYTPRTLARIARLFDLSGHYATCIPLGGKQCNQLHFEYITKPIFIEKKKDRRFEETEKYWDLVRQSIQIDMKGPSNEPSFYAFIIMSNFKSELF